jgi:hypothetical protein
MVLLVIKNALPEVGHLDDYRHQFYYSRVRKELFIYSIDTISNKSYFNQRLDASITITTNFITHGYGRNFLPIQMVLLVIKKYHAQRRMILLLTGVDGIIYRPN